MRAQVSEMLHWLATPRNADGRAGGFSSVSPGGTESVLGQVGPWQCVSEGELPPGGGKVLSACPSISALTHSSTSPALILPSR